MASRDVRKGTKQRQTTSLKKSSSLKIPLLLFVPVSKYTPIRDVGIYRFRHVSVRLKQGDGRETPGVQETNDWKSSSKSSEAFCTDVPSVVCVNRTNECY